MHIPATCFHPLFAALASVDLNLEEKTKDGDVALTLAAEAGRVENVRMLLRHGASPHNTNSRNESPLLIGSTKTPPHTSVWSQLGQISHSSVF